MERYDILIIGAGAAGIAAAKAAADGGCKSILLADRKAAPGGVLLQCAHRGFGRQQTGPEYAAMLAEGLSETVRPSLNTAVLSISGEKTAVLSGSDFGVKTVAFRQLILATGCMEISMGALPIAGTRPQGVYTAGQMQERMNLHGHVPEGPAVILGSGDLGLIMAKHLAEAGVTVTLVEQKAVCGGMARNQACLMEHPIRLLCGRTVTEVLGRRRLEGVRLSDGMRLPCKTLLIAVGLRPDRELIQPLGAPDWLQLCGNCSHVHSMIESVAAQGSLAGRTAWERLR